MKRLEPHGPASKRRSKPPAAVMRAMAQADAVEQNKAITDILRVISASPTDIQPVLRAVAENAARLCRALNVHIRLVKGDLMPVVEHVGPISLRPQATAQRISPRTIAGRAITERRTIHIHDIAEAGVHAEYPEAAFPKKSKTFRTVLVVPLLRDESAIGTITIRRAKMLPFSQQHIKLLETFAAQAVIAIENARLFNETKEALERQTATAGILRVITSSPTDLKPVMASVVENAARLAEADHALIGHAEGSELRWLAAHGCALPEGTRSITRDVPSGRAMLDLQSTQVEDVAQIVRDAAVDRAYRQLGIRTIFATPLVREGRAIGVLLLRRTEVRPFTDKQIALLKTFADQAAIAIENVRLFNETREALARQTATSEILRVISSSRVDLQPVFETIVRNFTSLCGTVFGGVFTSDGEWVHYAGSAGFTPEQDRAHQAKYPVRVDDPSVISARAIFTRAPVHVQDVLADPHYDPDRAAMLGVRRLLGVPMLRHGVPLGAIVAAWGEPGATPEHHQELLKTFADQAAIAIENVRLFNETREALEQQTATAEILRVISSSPNDIQPVFDSIVEHAMRLCDAGLGTVGLYDGKNYRHVAQRGGSPQYVKWLFGEPFEPGTDSTLGRMIAEQRPFHIADYRELASYREGNPRSVATVDLGGARTYLAVPMLKDGRVIGGITIRRAEVRPFAPKQIDLVSTFASQAVIAIENVRLFNETKEALERQTASAEVLRVISATPTDAQPVFEAIAQSALRVFKVSHVGINVVEGGAIRVKATGGRADPRGEFAVPLDRNSTAGRSVLDRALIQVEDTEAPGAASFTRDSGRLVGFRAIATAPMLREGTAVGSVSMMRDTPGAFADKQLELLQTFADQAAIAIENARLFSELQSTNGSLREALEQQTATGEILNVISRSTTDVQPVFETIIRNAVRLCDGAVGVLFRYDGKLVDVGAQYNFSPEVQALYAAAFPQPASPDNPGTRPLLDGRASNIEDIESAEYALQVKDRARAIGYRSLLTVPMLRDGLPIGAINVARRAPGRFSDSHVALLTTFADQAVIAIENVRLFNETKEALEQQTAISEVLRVISNSPADVQPVLEAVAERAAKICDAGDAQMFLREGDVMKHVARFGPLAIGVPLGDARPLTRGWVAGRAALEGRAIHIEDLLAVPREEYPVSHELRDRAGHRTLLSVPLMRERRALGAISLRRMEVRPFTAQQIALLQTFADQAAIAIENARLFNETREALEQQKASAEVLGTISSSIADTRPVFDKIVESCARLFEGQQVGILLVGEDGFAHSAALHGGSPELLAQHTPVPLTNESATGRAILSRQVMHYPDIFGGKGVPPYLVANATKFGVKSQILAPMLWEGRGIGVIFVGRETTGEFSEKAIRLLKIFADQAVIAIQNARLFREIQEKSAQLEVANKHKSDFLANMSHELRTPLNAIIGFSEALMEKMFGELNDKQSDYLKDIHESGRHLLSLINDILDLSKIEAGRMELEVSSFDLPTALSNAMTLVRERAQRHAIDLRLEVDERLAEFSGDERKFKQIMLNLLSNAVKFTPDGGQVDVCARKHNGQIEVAVRDTGIGIAPEDQTAVFEEFRQVGRDQTRKAEGTGLGLALTRRFVELHGGAIRLESAPGKGSTFTVWLPIQ